MLSSPVRDRRAFRERKPDMTGSRAGRVTTIGFVFSDSLFDVQMM
jgi:hypothetical protein